MLICDTHCDALWRRCYHPDEQPVVTPEHLARGGVSLQVLALFSGTDAYAERTPEVARRELAEFRRLQREAGWEQAQRACEAEEGKTKYLLSIEGGEVLEGSCERLAEFAREGVRMVALTWNRENEIGTPALRGDAGGIKPAGWAILREMAHQRIAADVSHLNRQGFYDLIERHSQPPMASHSCVRSLCDHPRNLDDAQIRALIARGGWIGVNFCPAFLAELGAVSVETLCDHIDAICQMGGAAHVGLGSDYDGIDSTPLGLETPEGIPRIFDALRRRGYLQAAIEGIAGQNFLNYERRLLG